MNPQRKKVSNINIVTILKYTIMKKFMFAAIAAMVMVSVSNVFASSRMAGNAEVAPAGYRD